MSTTLLVDGPNMAMRAIHAGFHGHMSVGETNTAAVTIFINSLGKLIREESPAYLGIAWDSPERGYRYSLHEGYKANRVDSPVQDIKDGTFALIHEFCALAGIRGVLVPTLEADDIIANWWYHAVQGPILIASSDHDFLQLAGRNPQGIQTFILRFGNGGIESRWSADDVGKFYDSPEHYPLIAALSGDTSDNIPGIRGIGPKKAMKLLQKHEWDLESALDEFPEEREKVRAYFQMINLRDSSYALAASPLPVPRDSGLTSDLEEFLVRYELRGTLEKFRAGTFWRGIPYRRPSR
jgi:DNA polymerase I